MTKEQAAQALKDTKPFVSGPLLGIRVSSSLYIVQSYGETIAAVVRDVGCLVTTEKFTVTTSRHTSMVRKAWQGFSREVPQSELIAAIASVAGK